MSDMEPTEDHHRVGGASPRFAEKAPMVALSLAASAAPSGNGPELVAFDRCELREILHLYGRKVATGEWRDYAIDSLPHKAVFSIFRRSCEFALYRIEKNPKLARRQGAYSVVTATGLILKRGRELARVIAVLDKKFEVISS